MFPTNPAVTDGVELFVWIVVILISFVFSIVDFRNVKERLNLSLLMVANFTVWHKNRTKYSRNKQNNN